MSLNGYGYVHANPVNLTDASGANPFLALATVAGGSVAALALLAAALGIAAVVIGGALWCLINGCWVNLTSIPERTRPDELDDPVRWVPVPQQAPAPPPAPDPGGGGFSRAVAAAALVGVGVAWWWLTRPDPVPQPEPVTPVPPQPTPPTPTQQPCDPQRFTQWLGTGVREIRTGVEYDYQRQLCGANVYRVYDSSRSIRADADGGRDFDCYLLDCKYIKDPDDSPYVLDIRNKIRSSRRELFEKVFDPQEDDLFRRYGAIIADPQTPAIGLEVITNEARSETYWQKWINKHAISNAIIRKT